MSSTNGLPFYFTGLSVDIPATRPSSAFSQRIYSLWVIHVLNIT